MTNSVNEALPEASDSAARRKAAGQERQDDSWRGHAEQATQREERLRTTGKQLNEEAAQRDTALNCP